MNSGIRFFSFLVVLCQVAIAPSYASNLPLFPGTSPVLCSIVDFPWYICDQSENFDEEAIPTFYNRLVSALGGGTLTEEESAAANPGTRRYLRK